VTSYLERFRAGEHEPVWAEIGRLAEVPAEQVDDVTAVATETMRRVAAHVRRIADGLAELGFERGSEGIPVHEPPTDDELADIARLDEETGGLPIAFAACLREVGGVSFLGDCAALQLFYNEPYSPRTMPPGPEYPDPLSLPPASYLRDSWDEFREDAEPGDEFGFAFAPDELHKANISGSTHVLYLPDRSPDPVIYRVAGRRDVTLVTYLRISIGWGGFPGWSFEPDRAPAALAQLRAEPDF
jgi:hypothetical protein